jgi:hypothetical protein
MAKETTTLSEGFLAGAIMLLLALVYLIPAFLLKAWVLTKLWGWYLVPFFGARPLSLPLAFGLATIASFLVPAHPQCEKDQKWYISASRPFMAPLFDLLAVWIGTFWL